jgi:hypothetical protein
MVQPGPLIAPPAGKWHPSANKNREGLMGKKVLGYFMVLAGMVCGSLAMLEAGLSHGWRSFSYRFPGNLGKGMAPVALGGMAILLIVGLVLLFRRGKPREPSQ